MGLEGSELNRPCDAAASNTNSNIIKMFLFRVCRSLFFSFGHCIERGTVLFFNLCQGVHCSLVGLFVSRITQKLLNGFPQKLDGGRLTAQL